MVEPKQIGFKTEEQIKQMSVSEALSAYQSIMSTRMNLAQSMFGSQYNGDRNIFEALGYPTETIGYSTFESKYKRTDIAKAIIDRPADATWRGQVEIYNPEDKDNETLKKAWEKIYYEFNLKQKFLRVDKMANLGRYAILYLGFNGVTAEQLIEPVKKGAKLLYVTPYSEENAQIDSYVEDTSDKRYGLPDIYQLKTEIGEKIQQIKVHHSRVIHITGQVFDNDVFGIPILESIYNRLLDLEKLVGGGAEVFWRNARPGITGKVTPDFNAPNDLKDILDDQMKEYEHGLRRFLIAEGVDMTPLTASIGDPASNVEVQIQMISAVTGIPKRILVGSERGELSSSQDKDSWIELITTRREEFAELQILYPFIDKMMELGILPQSKTYSALWYSLYEVSNKDKADIGKVRTEALSSYNANPMTAEMMPPQMFFKHFLGLSDEQIEEINQYQDEYMQEIERQDKQEQEEIEREFKQDGSGPNGQGKGPGKGKADGTGLKKEMDKEMQLNKEEGQWATIRGSRVFFGKDGVIEKGPKELIGTKGKQMDWKKTTLIIEGREIEFHKNPNFEKPEGGIDYYHETEEQYIDSIKEKGLDAEIAGEIWANDSKTFKEGVKEGYQAGVVFVVSIPKKKWKESGTLVSSEQGTEFYDSIKPEWIKGVLFDN